MDHPGSRDQCAKQDGSDLSKNYDKINKNIANTFFGLKLGFIHDLGDFPFFYTKTLFLKR